MSQFKFLKRSIVCIICLLMFLSVGISVVSAQDAVEQFQSKLSYDVYLLGGEEEQLSVVRDVEILRIETIHDITFLVIRPHGFSFKKAEGFIRFDVIRLVLPNREVKIGNTNTPEIKFR